jgi:PAS domain S-box-containing protein
MELQNRTKEQLIETSESHPLLSDIIDFLPDPTFVIDIKGQVLAWNRAIEEMTGVRSEEILGKGDYEYALPFYGSRRPLLIDLVFESDEVVEKKYHYVRREQNVLLAEADLTLPCGKHVFLWGKASPIYDSRGEIIAAIESIRDITHHKLTDDALHQSEKRFTIAFHESPTPTIISSLADGRYVDVNERFLQMLGYARDEVIGLTAMELGVWVDPGNRIEVVNKLRRNGVVREEPLRLRAKGGNIRDVLVSAQLLRVQDKDLILSLFQDVTERKLSERALHESEQRFRMFTEKAPLGISLIGSDMDFQYVNPMFTELFGYTVLELPNKKVWFEQAYPDPVYRAELMSLWNRDFIECPEVGKVTERLVTVRCKNGEERQIIIRAVLMDDGRYLLTYQDITELMNLQARVRQAQKLEALGELSGGIAHDFNNILAPIIGYTELALGKIDKGSRLFNNIEQVLAAAHRAKDLVKRILSFSRKSERAESSVRLADIIHEIDGLLRASLPATIRIQTTIPHHVRESVVIADPTEMHQVIMNLCTNASHAMQEQGGLLELKIKNVMLGSEGIEAEGDVSPSPYVKLSVSDTGHGMDEKTIERIFDPYFTTKGTGEGTGLGLAVVHGIVNACKGAIRVRSKPGKGTTFDVFLPCAERIAQPVETDQTTLHRGHGCILVVEDEEAILEFEKQVLEGIGCEVLAISSSRGALEAFLKEPNRFDLVVTDMTMPNMTGADLARTILSVREDIPVILCTGFSELIDEEKAGALGIAAYLMKPVRSAKLAETVWKLLNTKSRCIERIVKSEPYPSFSGQPIESCKI